MSKVLFNYLDWTHNDERKELNAYGAIGYYRVVKIAQYLKGIDSDVMGKEILHFGKTNEENWGKLFDTYDALWCNYGFGEASLAAMIWTAQQKGKKIIMDVDDNYLDVPESNEMHDKFQKGKKEKALLSTALSFCDIITTSTEPLRDRLKEHFKTVHGLDKEIIVIPNMNDINDWQFEPAPKHKDKIVIGYAGSNSHQDDLVMIMPVISKLMNKYPKLHFELMGAVPGNKVKEYFGRAGFTDSSLDRISLLSSTATFNQYPKRLSESKWDIGIAPLVDTPFTRAKSHIKWMEYATMKIPTVASRVYPYYMELAGRQTIDDGFNGYLCRNNDDWERNLELLINDKAKREEIGSNAYDTIVKDWQYKDYDWKAVAEKVLKTIKK